MRKYVFVACVCITFLSVMLTGCEDEVYGDTIDVSVSVSAYVEYYSVAYEEWQHYASEGWVSFDITKSGGEGVHESKMTNLYGQTGYVNAHFEVYKSQRIEIVATVDAYNWELGRAWKDPNAVGRQSVIISWDEISEAAGGLGGSCTFTKDLTLAIIEP